MSEKSHRDLFIDAVCATGTVMSRESAASLWDRNDRSALTWKAAYAAGEKAMREKCAEFIEMYALNKSYAASQATRMRSLPLDKGE